MFKQRVENGNGRINRAQPQFQLAKIERGWLERRIYGACPSIKFQGYPRIALFVGQLCNIVESQDVVGVQGKGGLEQALGFVQQPRSHQCQSEFRRYFRMSRKMPCRPCRDLPGIIVPSQFTESGDEFEIGIEPVRLQRYRTAEMEQAFG